MGKCLHVQVVERSFLCIYEILLRWKTERDKNRLLPEWKVSIEYQPKRTLFRHEFCDIMERKVAGPPSGKSETYSPPPGPRGPGHTIGHKVGAGCGCVHAPERDHPTSPPPYPPLLGIRDIFCLLWDRPPPGIPRCIKLSGTPADWQNLSTRNVWKIVPC